MIIDKQQNLYFISEFEPLHEIFEQKIQKLLVDPSIERLKEYMKELEKE